MAEFCAVLKADGPALMMKNPRMKLDTSSMAKLVDNVRPMRAEIFARTPWRSRETARALILSENPARIDAPSTSLDHHHRAHRAGLGRIQSAGLSICSIQVADGVEDAESDQKHEEEKHDLFLFEHMPQACDNEEPLFLVAQKREGSGALPG